MSQSINDLLPGATSHAVSDEAGGAIPCDVAITLIWN